MELYFVSYEEGDMFTVDENIFMKLQQWYQTHNSHSKIAKLLSNVSYAMVPLSPEGTWQVI